jgi:hypothetical protein
MRDQKMTDDFSRRGLFRRLLNVVAAPLLPRTPCSADGDREPRLVVNYLYDTNGRIISATYTLHDAMTRLSNA